jgi:hypothetical protein
MVPLIPDIDLISVISKNFYAKLANSRRGKSHQEKRKEWKFFDDELQLVITLG